jgi:single-strand selective monofunctional uracil DNA glycosylase
MNNCLQLEINEPNAQSLIERYCIGENTDGFPLRGTGLHRRHNRAMLKGVMDSNNAAALIKASRTLARRADALRFSPPVAYVYNPLIYAREPAEHYLARYGRGPKRVIFLGMNPGPWGMAQTGVPFGEIAAVRDWMGLEGRVNAPAQFCPARPVSGFACRRSEVSGRRLWTLMRERFGSPQSFFAGHFVTNYCPLMFLEARGGNRTPDKLPRREREPLLEICDAHLRAVIAALEPEVVIGIGKFTESRIRALAASGSRPPSFRCAGILHPSPANPRANRGWAELAAAQLAELGVWDGSGS